MKKLPQLLKYVDVIVTSGSKSRQFEGYCNLQFLENLKKLTKSKWETATIAIYPATKSLLQNSHQAY